MEINKLNTRLRKSPIQVSRETSFDHRQIDSIYLGEEMTRLEELEEQSRHLTDKVRTKRRKVEDIKNDLKVTMENTSIRLLNCFVSLAN